jgi:hypothetical protein
MYRLSETVQVEQYLGPATLSAIAIRRVNRGSHAIGPANRKALPIQSLNRPAPRPRPFPAIHAANPNRLQCERHLYLPTLRFALDKDNRILSSPWSVGRELTDDQTDRADVLKFKAEIVRSSGIQ